MSKLDDIWDAQSEIEKRVRGTENDLAIIKTKMVLLGSVAGTVCGWLGAWLFQHFK